MRLEFAQHASVAIDSGEPSTIRSEISVAGVSGRIADVNVRLDITHSFTADLEIALIGPGGVRVELVMDAGGGGDDFRSTVFDDDADLEIRDAFPPFTGSFRPQGSLGVFDGKDPNTTWVLEIHDDAFRDGGELQRWFLEIETEDDAGDRLEFHSTNPIQIRPDQPDTAVSAIHVTGHLDRLVAAARVTVDIEHSFTQDLKLTLIGPLGDRVVLADRVGGAGQHFALTTFSDDAKSSIRKARAPFSGSYRPEESLGLFSGKTISGAWRLEIQDRETEDGGVLKTWSIEVEAPAERIVPDSEFHIDVEFLGGLTTTQRAVFHDAAARWEEIIVGDLPPDIVNGVEIDDVVIGAQGKEIDGAGGPDGNVLGQAGPIHLRDGSLLPSTGKMAFDSHDLAEMEADGSLMDVIVHEMGHVLGIGTLWSLHNLLQDPVDGFGEDNPVFVGPRAIAEYALIRGGSASMPVPVADRGGAGTRNGHWRERTFDNELMTGWINQGTVNPISRMSVASLEDLGYQVNLDAADAYGMPALMAIGTARGGLRTCCTLHTRVEEGDLLSAIAANAAKKEVTVGEKLSWNLKVGSASGGSVSDTGSANVEGVFYAPAELPAGGDPVAMDIQLGNIDKLDVLLISSTVYDGKLEVKADGPKAVKLTGPLALFGSAIGLFATSLETLTLQNKSDQDATVEILIGRRLTA